MTPPPASAKRIARDLIEISRQPPPKCCSALPICEDNIYKWNASIIGAPETPYAGGTFSLAVNFPEEYPFKPPEVIFNTRIYHCNLQQYDPICIDNWCPVSSISKVLLSIYLLLIEPNPYHPFDQSIGQQHLNEREKYDTIAREWTKKYAQ